MLVRMILKDVNVGKDELINSLIVNCYFSILKTWLKINGMMRKDNDYRFFSRNFLHNILILCFDISLMGTEREIFKLQRISKSNGKHWTGNIEAN